MSHETSTASAKQIRSSQRLALGILPLPGAQQTQAEPMLVLHGHREGILHHQQGCSARTKPCWWCWDVLGTGGIHTGTVLGQGVVGREVALLPPWRGLPEAGAAGFCFPVFGVLCCQYLS